jgi:hypothetical protein
MTHKNREEKGEKKEEGFYVVFDGYQDSEKN